MRTHKPHRCTPCLWYASSLPIQILLILGLMASTSLSFAGTATLICEDTNDLGSCSFTEGSDSTGMSSFLQLINDIDDCRGNTQPGNTVNCTRKNGVAFSCNIISENTAQCRLPGSVDVGCTHSQVDDSANCTLNNDAQEEAAAILTQEANQLPQPLRETARVLGAACVARNGSQDFQRDCDLILEAVADNDPNIATVLTQLTANYAAIADSLAISSVMAQDQNITQRLNSLRRRARGFDTSGLQHLDFKKNGDPSDQDLLLEANSNTTYYTGGNAGDEIAEEGKLAGFINGTFISGEKDGTDQEIGADMDTQGITIGVDYRFSPNAYAGVAFGFASSSTDFDGNRGELDSTGYNLTLYGTFYYKQVYYFDATISFGGIDYEQTRSLRFQLQNGTNVDQVAEADYFSDQLVITLRGGYEYILNSLTLTPYVQLAHQTFNMDDYQESMSNPSQAGSGLALALDDNELNALPFIIGTQVSYVISEKWGILLPMARVEWVNDLDSDDRIIEGRFVGDAVNQAQFKLNTNDVDDSYFNLGLGLSAATSGGSTFFCYYQTLLSFDDYSQNAITAGYRWEF